MSPINSTLHGEFPNKKPKKASTLSNPMKKPNAATRLRDEETAIEHSQLISKRRPPTKSKATPSQETHIIIATHTTGTTMATIETATIAAEAEEEDRTEAEIVAISSATDNTNQAAGIMAEAGTTITKRETMWNIRKRIKSNRDRREEIDSIAIEITEKITIDSTIIKIGEKTTTTTEATTEIIIKKPTEIASNMMIGRKTANTTHKKTSKTQSPQSQRPTLRSSLYRRKSKSHSQ